MKPRTDQARPSVPVAAARAAAPQRLSQRLRLLLMLAWLLTGFLLFSQLRADTTAVIVHGLGGMPEYEENFTKWSQGLEETFRKGRSAEVLLLDGREVRRDEILDQMRQVASRQKQGDELWLFLVGHANVNRQRYKFNIKGPDLTDEDLSAVLGSMPAGRAFVVVATNSSGGLAAALSKEGRVVVTATRGVREKYPPLFLSFFLEAAESAQADSDKNGKVSLLEAYYYADRRVKDWFEEEGRIQTEHPLLADQTSLILGVKKEGEEEEETPHPDVSGANLLASLAYLSEPPQQAYRNEEARRLAEERQDLERQVEALKFQKSEMPSSEYYQKLEALLVRLAELNQRIQELEGETEPDDGDTPSNE
ncbi:MAG TPA: hypothetical protein VLV83_11855 [Acidobacteriota bacterium]|nr:hypothetical protein [Acidobacteriota bacterium]